MVNEEHQDRDIDENPVKGDQGFRDLTSAYPALPAGECGDSGTG